MDCKELGNCLCVHCNTKVPHTQGTPCKETVCPTCGKRMIRENGYHHELYKKKFITHKK